MARFVSFAVLVLATSILLALFFKVVSVFLLPLFLAVVAVLLLRPVQIRATAWCGNRRYLAALLMTLGVLLAVLIPASTVVMFAGTEAVQLVSSLDDEAVAGRIQRLRSTLDLQFPMIEECRFIEASLDRLLVSATTGAATPDDRTSLRRASEEFAGMHRRLSDADRTRLASSVEQLVAAFQAAEKSEPGTLQYIRDLETVESAFHSYKVILAGGPWQLAAKELSYPDRAQVQGLMQSLFSMTTDRIASISGALMVLAARFSFSLMIFVMALFFWFADGPEIVRALTILSPLEDKYEQQLLAEFERLVRAVVAGSIASAAAQAILAGIGFWVVGVSSIFLLMAATAVFAMVPFVGASLIWGPVSLWLMFAEGRMGAGVGLGVYGLVVISTVDNVVRPWIIVEKASLHPLAALLGVLGGIQALGPSGVFVGPIVVAFLQTILTLLHREFSESASEDAGDTSESPPETASA